MINVWYCLVACNSSHVMKKQAEVWKENFPSMRDGGTQRNSEVMDDSPCTLADQADRGTFKANIGNRIWKKAIKSCQVKR